MALAVFFDGWGCFVWILGSPWRDVARRGIEDDGEDSSEDDESKFMICTNQRHCWETALPNAPATCMESWDASIHTID